MTRVRILTIVMSALAGAIFFSWHSIQSHESDLSKLADLEKNSDTIVYAIRDVREGEPIELSGLESKVIESSKVPTSAIRYPSRASGKRARYGIAQGQIVTYEDLQ